MRNPEIAAKNAEKLRIKYKEDEVFAENLRQHMLDMSEKARLVNTSKKRPEHSALLQEIKGDVYIITKPDGEVIEYKNLSKFAKENDLSYGMLFAAYKENIVSGSKNSNNIRTDKAKRTVGYAVKLKEKYENKRNVR